MKIVKPYLSPASARLLETLLSRPRGVEKVIPRLVELYCFGKGIEIGPGKRPYCDPKRTTTLDKHISNKDGCPDPDIVGNADRIPIEDEAFDFLFSAHCLEHTPNTIKVLNEWIRVLRPSGILFLVLPHGDRTFDRYRAKSTLEHHKEDFERLGDAISDPSHFDEMKEGWIKAEGKNIEQKKEAYERAWGAPIWDFESRIKNDVLHYHVWTQDEMIDVLKYLNLKILHVCELVPERTDSFVIVARKAPDIHEKGHGM